MELNNKYMEKIIEIRNLYCSYDGIEILHDINLEIYRGDFVGIIGPNGAGKSTLLKCISGLISWYRGAVEVFGEDIRKIKARTRARIMGLVPQWSNFFGTFTVENAIMIGRLSYVSPWGIPSEEDRKIVEKIMTFVDVIHLRHRRLFELSGGELQRVRIGIALAQEPQILILDEPLAHLDINHQVEVMQMLEQLNKRYGVTVIMVSHDLNLLLEYCSKMCLMADGYLLRSGEIEKVLDPEILSKVYHCPISVKRIEDKIVVLTARRIAKRAGNKNRRLHIIAGGGTCRELLRILNFAGYSLTCGVVNKGDSDSESALGMQIDCILEEPFTAISEKAYGEAKCNILNADAIIVGPVPFGPANLANLKLCLEAIKEGKKVFIFKGIEERDYTPDKAASAIAEELVRLKAVVWSDIERLMEMIESIDAS